MVWQFYTALSLQVFDQMLKIVSSEPKDSPSETAVETPDKHLSTLLKLHEIGTPPMAESEQKNYKAELATMARSKYVSDLSHDLRTPLNAILGFAQMMENEVLGPIGNTQYKEYLRHIKESGYALLDHIEDLLDTPIDSAPKAKAIDPVKEMEEDISKSLLLHGVIG